MIKPKLKKLNFIRILFLGFLVLNSCTIQKKLHSRGYNIERKKSYNSKLVTYEVKSIDTIQDRAESSLKKIVALSINEIPNSISNKTVINSDTTIKRTTKEELKADSNITKKVNLDKKEGINQKNGFTFYQPSATFYAMLADIGFLIILLGLLLSLLAIIDLGVVLFVICGLSINIVSVIYGFLALQVNEGVFPEFARATLFSFAIFWLLSVLGIGIYLLFFN